LGFDSLEQVRIAEAIREAVSAVGQGFGAGKQLGVVGELKRAAAAAGVLGLALAAFALWRPAGRRRASPPAAPSQSHLSRRRALPARRGGRLPPSGPPRGVARGFGQFLPAAREDANAVVLLYCASAFGGRPLTPESARDLSDRVKRLRKLA